MTLLPACSIIPGDQPRAIFNQEVASSRWIILPLSNDSTATTASDSARTLIETQLRAGGIASIDTPPSGVGRDMLSVLAEARVNKLAYALTGAVQEWRYTGPHDRTPTASITMSVIDVATGQEVWSDSAQGTGRVSNSLSNVGDRVVNTLISRLSTALRDTTIGESKQQTANQRAVDVASEQLIADTSIKSGFQSGSPLTGAVRTLATSTDEYALAVPGQLNGRGTAIFYGRDAPFAQLAQFDRVVVEPDNVDIKSLGVLKRNGAAIYAYVSVGEIGPNRSWFNSIKSQWILGRNETWNSSVMDLTSKGWTEFLLKRIDSLVNAGYDGLFLDTLDSYQLYATSENIRVKQEAGLASIVNQARQQHPGLRLIANRGFEVLESIGEELEAIAAESLYAGWDNNDARYVDVNAQDRDWLIGRLKDARDRFNLDVIAIDYLPPERRAEAERVAASISSHGFIPWVATPSLDYLGVGAMEVMPREVLLLFDSRYDGLQEVSAVHRMLATPLEYLGYVPVYLDLSVESLPTGQLKGRYAGIVSWTNRTVESEAFKPWLKKQIKATVPIVFMGTPSVTIDAVLATLIGIENITGIKSDEAIVTTRDSLIGFERDLPPRFSNPSVNLVSRSDRNTVHLGYGDSSGSNVDLVVTGPWGGYALNPGVTDDDPNGVGYWILDPFEFLQSALQLPVMPQPDVTTLNGRRLWLAHIDGDALPSWAEMPGERLGAEVIQQEIIERYSFPHTVSVVEAEMTEFPQYFDRRKRMFSVIDKMFTYPTVELASHTFSHPFKWGLIGEKQESGKYNLYVQDYKFSIQREIAGSIDFVNTRLAPSNKKARLILWSGDALPTREALAVADDNQLLNMNGGFTMITNAEPAMSLVTPMARTVDEFTQVYSPITNENVYTNDWTGPFSGFRRVIETFELTEKPRRLKPVNIYYHFYSGTKRASMRALREVYDWSLTQDIFPVYASEYAELVPAFRRAGVSRYLDGTWKLTSLGPIQSIRLQDNVWPVMSGSDGLVGAKQLHDGAYLHTNGSDSVSFGLATKQPVGPHLLATNGRVLVWEQDGGSLRFRLQSHVPLILELGGASGCSVLTDNGIVRGKTTDNNTRFNFNTRDSGNAVLNCQA